MSPRLESLNDEPLPRTTLLKAELKSETSPAPETPSTPSLPKKKVTIADYKRRKQASRSESVDESVDQAPLVSLLTNPSILSTKVPVTTLPELPGLETRNPAPQSLSPVFDMKRTRSNSPLSFKEKTRSSPLEMKMRSGSPQLERRPQRTGSPAKVRERTNSPRKPSSGVVKHEKWESKTRDSTSKGEQFHIIYVILYQQKIVSYNGNFIMKPKIDFFKLSENISNCIYSWQ